MKRHFGTETQFSDPAKVFEKCLFVFRPLEVVKNVETTKLWQIDVLSGDWLMYANLAILATR